MPAAPAPNTEAANSEAPETEAPKIELHVHLEGAVRPRALLEIAARNGVSLPASTEAGLAELYQFRDFAHFLELWLMTTRALQTERDFRQVVVDYATEAAACGAVYLEGIFTPAERAGDRSSWDEVFTGFCDGAAEAKEKTGVEVRLTPDIPRNLGPEVALNTARYAVKYRERGVVGLGLGGPEDSYPGAPLARAFQLASDGGNGYVPNAG
jgi:aminodeoxyfutalosine deaminase